MSQSQHDPHIDIADHPIVWRWIKEMARKDPTSFSMLTRDNTDSFDIIFGPAKYRSNGEKGWCRGWSFVQYGMAWLVTTGPQGTVYRIKTVGDGEEYLKDPKVSTGAIQFFQSLQQQLTDL